LHTKPILRVILTIVFVVKEAISLRSFSQIGGGLFLGLFFGDVA
jgi:hypothetical protein